MNKQLPENVVVKDKRTKCIKALVLSLVIVFTLMNKSYDKITLLELTYYFIDLLEYIHEI